MKKSIDIVRALKDTDYRATLSAAELAQVPQSAAGKIELSDEALRAVAGGELATRLRPVGDDEGACGYGP